VRVVCGCAILLVGYSPLLFDFFNNNFGGELTYIDSDVNFLKNDANIDNLSFDLTYHNSLADSNMLGYLIQNAQLNDKYSPHLERCTKDVSRSSRIQLNVCEHADTQVKIVAAGPFSGARVIKSSIQSSFYVDARKLGIPAKVIDRVINNLSAKIDFRRSLKKGDLFEIVYNQKNDVLYSRITAKHCNVAAYRFSDSNYYFENGMKIQSGRKNAFGQPLERGLRVASPFGYRVHPISGRWGRHTGVDFVANYGTPVFAIFDGVVTRASRYYGYGHCVDIKHQSGYMSRYAHLSGYSVHTGMRVKKGQIIGRVGSSGSTTGSHLHLELARNHKILNPMTVKMMPTESSVVPNLKKFNTYKKQIARVVCSCV
jgi:murein DD-endopeptidase MepM/ murein hydrolase activator NlpD